LLGNIQSSAVISHTRFDFCVVNKLGNSRNIHTLSSKCVMQVRRKLWGLIREKQLVRGCFAGDDSKQKGHAFA
jgi:hypothetical protein